MTRRKLGRLRQQIAQYRHQESIGRKTIERLAKAVKRKRKGANTWSHKVLANRPPLTIPMGKTIAKNAALNILDILSGDLDAYEETIRPSEVQPKNGHRRRP